MLENRQENVCFNGLLSGYFIRDYSQAIQRTSLYVFAYTYVCMSIYIILSVYIVYIKYTREKRRPNRARKIRESPKCKIVRPILGIRGSQGPRTQVAGARAPTGVYHDDFPEEIARVGGGGAPSQAYQSGFNRGLSL